MAHRLHLDQPIGVCLCRLLRGQLDEAAAAPARAQPPSLRIHKMRTAAKRLRATLRLLRPVDAAAARAGNRRLRDAMRPLSAARDADVLIASFDALVAHLGAACPPGPATAVRHQLLRRVRSVPDSRARISRELRAAAAAVRQIRRDLRTRWPSTATLADLDAGLRTTYATARAAFHQAKTKGSTAAFHEWRKRSKDLRYQLRLLRDAWPEVMKPLGREFARLADLLGDEHDLVLLRAALGEAGNANRDEAAVLLELLSTRRRELRRTALALGALLFADKPRVFARRIIGWWEVAQASLSVSR